MNLTFDIKSLAVEVTKDSNSLQPKASIFFNKNIIRPKIAIGKNDESLALHEIVGLSGIIDDYSECGSSWNGIPLLKTNLVSKDSLIANCSTSIAPVLALNHLENSGFKHIFCLNDLVPASGGLLSWPLFVSGMRNELEEYSDLWQSMLESMEDDESRKTFIDIVRFRLSANLKYMQNYTVRIADQYFEDFMSYSGEVFIDAGGFDGDTSQEFAQRYGDYKKILFFEPSAENMTRAKKRLLGYERIEFFPIGLSNSSGELKFNQNAGSASAISAGGSETIRVEALDNIIRGPITFIKMDLEGWELKALEGARSLISTYKPKLAVAVYHDSSDFRKIYQFMCEFKKDYRIFLRHYTQGWSETIMYFLPKGS